MRKQVTSICPFSHTVFQSQFIKGVQMRDYGKFVVKNPKTQKEKGFSKTL